MASLSALDIGPGDMINSDDVANGTIAGQERPAPVATSDAQTIPATQAFSQSDSGIDSSAIERALAGNVAPVPGAEVVTPEVTPAPAQMTPAQARIQQVIRERNEARQALASQQAQFQSQIQNQQAQIAAQNAKFQEEQLNLERRRLEMTEARVRAEEEASLSDTERARRAFLKDAATQAREELRKEFAPELTALKNENAARAQAQQQAQAQYEQAQRLNYFQGQAQQVLTQDLLKGWDPTDAAAVQSEFEEMLYAYSGAFGVDPTQAAPMFKTFLSKYFKGEAKRLSRSSGVKVAQSMGTPAVANTGLSAQGVQQAWPTMAQLKRGDGKQTFDNHIQWVAKGKPALRG